MSGDFYITLASNVNIDIGAQEHNTIGNFITRLPSKRVLTDEYRVAISSISYNKSWFNINKEEAINIQIQETDGTALNIIKCSLPPGNYTDCETLRRVINENILRACNKEKWVTINPHLLFDKIKQKFTIVCGISADDTMKVQNYIYVYFSEKLSNMLGFIEKDIGWFDSSTFTKFFDRHSTLDNNKHKLGPHLTATYIPQLEIIHSLYVYTDILAPIIVGNTRAPLLRQIEVPSRTKFGDACFFNYGKRFYHPLNHLEFDTIHIIFRDDTGKEIDFESGRTTLLLHFKKVNDLENIIKKLMK